MCSCITIKIVICLFCVKDSSKNTFCKARTKRLQPFDFAQDKLLARPPALSGVEGCGCAQNI